MLPAVLYALLLWWFTTGLIMAVYERPRWLVQRWFAGATLVMITAVGGLVVSASKNETLYVYVAFTCGTLIWGWHMASYYLGFVTGPVTKLEDKVTTGGKGWQQTEERGKWFHYLFSQRFRLALQAGLHHELLVLVFIALLASLTWSQPNRWGFWIFLTLWLMHSSAKLNVFLGVRNFRVEFLPSHLHFLKRLLKNQPSNEFFPISICLATSVVLILLYQSIQPGTTVVQATGSLLVGTIILLGIIEHWLLVLPLPAVLWGWGIRALPDQHTHGHAHTHGHTHGPRLSVPSVPSQKTPLQVVVVEQASDN